MEEKGHYTYAEILSQPDVWSTCLANLRTRSQPFIDMYRGHSYQQVLFTGCGSTYYLSDAAGASYQELTGKAGRGLPASELWLYPKSAYPQEGRILLAAVSRSGETSETLRACEAFKRGQRGDLLTLSCYPEMPLAKMGDLNLVLTEAQETSIAQTRALSTLYLASLALSCQWARRDDLYQSLGGLSGAAQNLLANYASLAKELGEDRYFDRYYFLGSGPRYGLACELSLKMKEMSLSHSEPFRFMEFRHGPKAMVTPNTLILGLTTESNNDWEMGVVKDMRNMGARVVTLGERNADVSFGSGLDEMVRSPLYLPFGQLLGFYHSLSKGLNPDRPNNLDAVVKL